MKKILILILVLTAFVKVNAQDKEDLYDKLTSSSMLQAISITIGGDFLVNGSFPATTVLRVDNFITQLAIQFQKENSITINAVPREDDKEKVIKTFPLRDIKLKRANGTIVTIDLQKFRMTGDFKYNPFLMNEDVLIFPTYNKLNNYVEIIGAVNKPTQFQFVDGDKLSDAILFAGGLNKAYENISTAEIYRINSEGKQEKITTPISSNIELKIGDRINIVYTDNYRQSYKAIVLGKVNKPGYLYVSKDGTSLKTIIENVGGIKEDADLRNAIIIRYKTGANKIIADYVREHGMIDNKDLLKMSISDRQELTSMTRLSNLTEEDSLYFYIDNYLRVSKEEKLVDFTQLVDSTSDASKFLIKDGDMIVIPEFINKVYVFGQVPRSGYVEYVKGNELRYYVDNAGGLTENSKDYDEVILIKGDTREWITGDDAKGKIEPGDFVYIPKDPPRTFSWYLNRVSLSAGIIGSVATVILLINQFGK